MIERKVATLDISTSTNGDQIVGNGAHSVFLNGKPVALVGSITSSGVAIVSPEDNYQVYIEGRKVARTGNTLADGSTIATTEPKV